MKYRKRMGRLTAIAVSAAMVIGMAPVQMPAVIAADAKTEKDAGTEEQLREQILTMVDQVEAKYVKGEYTFVVDQSVNTALAEAERRLADPNASVDSLTWAVTYLQRALDAMDKPGNKLSAIEKEIYQMIVDMEKTDPAQYTEESWAEYVAVCTSAESRVNGNYSDADMQKELDKVKAAFAALVKVDAKLTELRQLAAEKSKVVNEGYTRESWRAFKNAIWKIEEKGINNVVSIADEEYRTLKTNLEEAAAGLKKGTEGTEYGNVHLVQQSTSYVNVWKSKETNYKIRGGQLYVSNEKVNDDGTTTLTVTWMNDGLDPETGGLMHNVGIYNKPDWEKREFSARSWQEISWLRAIATLDGQSEYLYFDGTSGAEGIDISDCEGFTEAERAGFTKEITVKTGSEVVLELSGWNKPDSTYSLGVYHTVAKVQDTEGPIVNTIIDAGEDSVTVTMKANEAIADIEGWTRVDAYTLTKVYTTEGNFEVVVTDVAGNETTVKFKVTFKEKEGTGESTEPDVADPNESKDKDKTDESGTPKTGDMAQTGMFVAMTVLAAGAVVLGRKKEENE